MRDSRTAAVAGLGLLVALVLGWLAALAYAPPPPLGADAPAEKFSAARAKSLLDSIAHRPRPMGTEEHARVRDDLVARLTALGLEARVEEKTVLRWRRGRLVGARVANLVARLPGRGRDGAILLMAHYDSVPGSPGA